MENRIVLLAESLIEQSNEEISFYDKKFKCKTYLDKASQMCILETADVLKEADDRTARKTALITVSSSGCAVSRKKYLGQLLNLEQYKFASPMLFTHSLCNVSNCLTTIEFNIRGAANHFIGNADSTLLAFWQAGKYIEEFGQEYVVVTAYETVDREQDDYKVNRKQKRYCESGEGAGSILFVSEEFAIQHGKKPLLGIEQVSFVSGNDIVQAIENVDVVYTTSCNDLEATGVQVVVNETGLKSVAPFVHIRKLLQRVSEKESGYEKGSRICLVEKTSYGQYMLCITNVL